MGSRTKLCSLLLMVVYIGTTSAHPRRVIQPYPILPTPKCIPNLATPIPNIIEAIDCEYYDCGSVEDLVCNSQLILPPTAVELPRGLGYFPAALPLVSKCFEPALDYLTTGAYLPVTSSCDCLTLAAPVCHEWAPLVKPVIL